MILFLTMTNSRIFDPQSTKVINNDFKIITDNLIFYKLRFLKFLFVIGKLEIKRLKTDIWFSWRKADVNTRLRVRTVY